ncbi:tetratricopeptide (TPR) repeat protein [Runella defluvii]|uniref:Tetratricopeptide (TPR) repeat protein n=1 Tax=Runella defluvii TaxID=370973 RepID=A0A7W5ZJA5_9BACT|nr:tetratricopeptide repeat protein [Runella defluvii]MBB3837924.1 tetratricopeptide (TPR) repeat protein [Runella defluvii]
MKKLFLMSAFGLFTVSASAQVDKLLLEQKKKDKEKSDKAIADPKAAAKSSTWLDRGKLYDEIARLYTEMDSSAAMVAYDSFKKAVEVDATKPGKVTKEAQKFLTGGTDDSGVNLGQALVKQGAEKFQVKNYAGAIKFFTVAQEVNPKDTLAPLYGAYSAMQSQKNDVAATMMESYIDKGGKDASNYSLLAQLYRVEKQNDKALKILERGMTALPASKAAFKSEQVNVYLDMNKMTEAKAGLKELIELDPKNAQYPLNLGIINDNEGAVIAAEIRKLKDGAKKTTSVERKIKDAEETDKVFADEIKRIAGLIAKQPKNADLKRQKTEAETKQKENKVEWEAAKAELAKAKEEAAALGDVSAKLADLTAKQNVSRAAAKEAYDKALSIDGNNYDALFNLGVFYFNEAVEMKAVVDAMDMKDYNTKGKEVEAKVCGKFKQAQPYFVKAKAIKEEEQVVEIMKQLDTILKQFEEKKVVCEEAK